MSTLIATLFTGIAQAVPLFLIASGLSLLLGVMNVLNFAHGAFFLFGSYVAVSFLGSGVPSLPMFLLAVIVAAVVVGVVGVLADRLVLRTLYEKDHLIGLLATFALLLMMEGLALQVWGPNPRTQRNTNELGGAFWVGGVPIATYDIFLIIVGIVVAALLLLVMQRTMFGKRVAAVAHDRTMAAAIGIRTWVVGAQVFFLGAGLAGLAGGLFAPLVSVEASLASAFVLQCFAVVIVGGLGSIKGSLLAALVIGITESLAVSYATAFSGYSLFVAMFLTLLLRPQGLMGKLITEEQVA